AQRVTTSSGLVSMKGTPASPRVPPVMSREDAAEYTTTTIDTLIRAVYTPLDRSSGNAVTSESSRPPKIAHVIAAGAAIPSSALRTALVYAPTPANAAGASEKAPTRSAAATAYTSSTVMRIID